MTGLDRDAIRVSHVENRLNPSCQKCLEPWPCSRISLLDALDTAETERDRLARQVEAVRAQTLREFGDFVANPIHDGLDDYTLSQVRMEAYAAASTEGPEQ